MYIPGGLNEAQKGSGLKPPHNYDIEFRTTEIFGLLLVLGVVVDFLPLGFTI